MIVPCIIVQRNGWLWAQLLRRHKPNNRTMHRNINACSFHRTMPCDANHVMRCANIANGPICADTLRQISVLTRICEMQALNLNRRKFVKIKLLCKQHVVATCQFTQSTSLGHIIGSNIAYFITLLSVIHIGQIKSRLKMDRRLYDVEYKYCARSEVFNSFFRFCYCWRTI